MTDSRQLHQDAARLRQTATTKRQDASNALVRSEDYMKNGFLDRAAQESDRANRDYRESEELERTAMECDHRASAMEAQAFAVERRENELRVASQLQIDRMESQKKSLRG